MQWFLTGVPGPEASASPSSGTWTCPIRNSEGGAQQSVPTNSPGGYFILMNVFGISPPGIMPTYDLGTSLAKLYSST